MTNCTRIAAAVVVPCYKFHVPEADVTGVDECSTARNPGSP